MKISIVMTSYNYEKYISEAIESVIAQTYTNWELVIVDDGSKDKSVEIIKRFQEKDNRIKFYQHKNNSNEGLARSLKLGIEKAESNWIVFLESDDKLAPDSISEKVKAINSYKNIDLLFTSLKMFPASNLQASHKLRFDYINRDILDLNESKFIENFKDIIFKDNIIPTFSVVMLKKDILQDCDFNSPIESRLDWYLWAQLSDKNIYYLAKPLTYWRIHEDSYINKTKLSWIQKYLFKTKLYYLTIRNESIIKRIFLLLNYMRRRIIYLKINNKSIKLNIASESFIFEKSWK